MLEVGGYWGRSRHRKRILDMRHLSNGWILIKTENSKSEKDFKVKVIFSLEPQRSLTPKHAHFLIDFYGKMCADRDRAYYVLLAIVDMWHGIDVDEILRKFKHINLPDYPLEYILYALDIWHGISIDEILRKLKHINLPGYPLEYILYALEWILEQEDINFTERPPRKQNEIDKILKTLGIETPKGRLGSQLAIALLCDVFLGTHPVEALLKANLDIRPRR
jgi:hypothetical protein